MGTIKLFQLSLEKCQSDIGKLEFKYDKRKVNIKIYTVEIQFKRNSKKWYSSRTWIVQWSNCTYNVLFLYLLFEDKWKEEPLKILLSNKYR